MLEAMDVAAARAREKRSKPFNLDVDYFFIEKKHESFEYLREVLSESKYRKLLDQKVHLLQDEFSSQAPKIIEFVKQTGRARRSIFVLDQCGYSDVPLSTIRLILQELPNAEVILTFAVDSLIDYLSTNEQTQQLLAKIDISLSPQTIGEAKLRIGWRRKIQFLLHHEIPEKTGAKYYTPFFIRSHDAHRDYWLIHLSGHFRARDVMVGLHWKENTSFAHYGGSGLHMLGYNQETDSVLTGQNFLPGFYFDDTALESSRESLTQQLPERVAAYSNGVAFNDFFAQVTNDCPVTADLMKQVLNDLAKEGQFDVRDESGQRKRSGIIRAGSDIILPSRQMRLSFPLR
jgi:three-Cys-motif partner protein